MTALLELAERCEAATAEQEREIIVLAAEAAFLAEYGDVDTEEAMGRIDRFEQLVDARAFTDAALTLVPEGWRFIVDSDGCHCRMTRTSREGRDVTGFASTIALAICAAALRARASEQNNG